MTCKFKQGDQVSLALDPNKRGTVKAITLIIDDNNPIYLVRVVWNTGNEDDYPEVDLCLDSNNALTLMDVLNNPSLYFKAYNPSFVLRHLKLINLFSDNINILRLSGIFFTPDDHQYLPVIQFLKSIELGNKGILVADEVGLGKTLEAGIILRELQHRYDANKVLIVCPASLKSNWEAELKEKFRLDVVEEIKSIDTLISNLKSNNPFYGICSINLMANHQEELGSFIKEMGKGSNKLLDLIIIDESHELRNNNSKSRIIAHFKKICEFVVLLSATPINLAADDLKNQLNLLIEESEEEFENDQLADELNKFKPCVHLRSLLLGHKLEIDNLNLYAFAKKHQKTLIDLRIDRDLLSDLISDQHDFSINNRFKLLQNIDSVGHLANLVTRTKKRDTTLPVINRVPKKVEVVRCTEEIEAYADVIKFCEKLISATRFKHSIYEKMMASSIAATYSYLTNKFATLSSLDQDSVDVLDSDFTEEIEDQESSDLDFRGTNLNADTSIKFEPVKGLAQILREKDTKLAQLILDLDLLFTGTPDKLSNDSTSDKAGANPNCIIIFSFFKTTVKYLSSRLKERFGESAVFEAMGGSSRLHKTLADFETAALRGKTAILVATDVASQGFNFQFCGTILNYDLPWNPMRVEQRIGRIDRRGQQRKSINIFNYYYKDTKDEQVYSILWDRIKLFEGIIGSLEPILGDVGEIISNVDEGFGADQAKIDAIRAKLTAGDPSTLAVFNSTGSDLNKLANEVKHSSQYLSKICFDLLEDLFINHEFTAYRSATSVKVTFNPASKLFSSYCTFIGNANPAKEITIKASDPGQCYHIFDEDVVKWFNDEVFKSTLPNEFSAISSLNQNRVFKARLSLSDIEKLSLNDTNMNDSDNSLSVDFFKATGRYLVNVGAFKIIRNLKEGRKCYSLLPVLIIINIADYSDYWHIEGSAFEHNMAKIDAMFNLLRPLDSKEQDDPLIIKNVFSLVTSLKQTQADVRSDYLKNIQLRIESREAEINKRFDRLRDRYTAIIDNAHGDEFVIRANKGKIANARDRADDAIRALNIRLNREVEDFFYQGLLGIVDVF